MQTKNNGILGENVLLRRCLTISKLLPCRMTWDMTKYNNKHKNNKTNSSKHFIHRKKQCDWQYERPSW